MNEIDMMSEQIKLGMFSDTTRDYVSPVEPLPDSDVVIYFRAKKHTALQVFFVWGKCHANMRFSEKKSRKDSQFDYYEVKIHLGKEKVSYYFDVQVGSKMYQYDLRGVVDNTSENYWFQIIPGFSTPKWAKGAVFYQIFVDRFYNGDKENDVLSGEYKYLGKLSRYIEDWNASPNDIGVGDFYGGDLEGVIQKLDYLKKLGVEVIYFNPLFLSPSNHKYDIQDYDHIDPHFGKIVYDKGDLLHDESQDNIQASRYIDRVTNQANLEASNQLFIKLIRIAHKKGMKVILDGVFNHCGSFNKWMDSEKIYKQAAEQLPDAQYELGAYISKDSWYNNFFYFTEDKWPDNRSYEGWWGHDTLPKLNYESKELYEEILRIAGKWIMPPYNADGWRLDVAADLGRTDESNHKFWQDFRKKIKEVNPNALILAEHYGNPFPWLQGNEWDSVMNYDAFMEPVTWFLTGMQKHSDEHREDLLGNTEMFWNAMMEYGTKFTASSLFTTMNELSNHDHSRFLTRTNRKVGRVSTLGSQAAQEDINKAIMREAVVIQMTWPGAPTIYYGDEAGLCGFTDPDNRRPYPWGKEDNSLIEFHRKAIMIHKQNKELRIGSLKPLYTEYNVLAYGRMNKGSISVVVVNNNDTEKTLTIPVWYAGVPANSKLTQLLITTKDGFSDHHNTVKVVNGEMTITLQETSAVILKYGPKKDIRFINR